ncbi:MAG: zinc-binding dehydrogenase [Candidatus Bathyarchaeia archaeon]|jgi:2-desacetyl-2-hydroxyethyl bacteriochlorophyllide A dehydrogenase
MKAARFYEPNKPLRIEEVPLPKIRERWVLVEVKACGICHSDLHITKGTIKVPKTPLILGHEISGRIADIGSEIEEFRKGDRVLVSGMIPCGECYYCASGKDNICQRKVELGIQIDGGYAQYVAVPSKNLYRMPDSMSYEEAAILTDAVATPFHAVKLGRVTFGSTVAVFGVGGLGMNAVQLSTLAGARVIAVDILDQKLALAKEFGAEETINSKIEDPIHRILQITNGNGVDVAFEFVGLPTTLEQAIASVRRGGKVVLAGVGTQKANLSMRDMTAKEIEIIGVQGFVAHTEYPALIDMVVHGRLDVKKMISQTVPLEEVNRGLDILEKQIGNPIRVVLKP